MLLKIKEVLILFIVLPLIVSCSGITGGDTESDVTVAFNTRNGTYVEPLKIHSGTLIVEPGQPSHSNGVFAGWYKENACINSWNFASDKSSTDIILYAKWTYNNSPEYFLESNRPNLELVSDPVNGDYFFSKPWNYELGYNSSRRYPLIIYLHGKSQAAYLRNLYYMGYDNSDGYQRNISTAFKQTYPCFTFVPEAGTSWSTVKLIAQIEYIKANYRIDTNRIYIHGFSMGAWGCYSLANAYYSYNGQLFAGIIRQSGMGTFTDSRIAAKTSVWLITGLRLSGASPETQSTIDDTCEAYNYLKNLPENSGALENRRSYYAGSHIANTWELIKNGREFAKRTEFPDDGHFTTEYPFLDPSVMAWLFDQSLEYR